MRRGAGFVTVRDFLRRKRTVTTLMPPRPPVADDLLARAQYQADPLADQTVAALLGPWPVVDGAALHGAALEVLAPHWERLRLLNRVIAGWVSNADVAAWQPAPDLPAPMARALTDYLASAHRLPDWADRTQIAAAEAMFFDQGLLSVLLLFCASLPECYVVPDLAEVLHTTGALEQRTDYRIRSTAAMIFPLMMRGGLTDPAGGGVAQVLKVRLIHATVRHLILRGPVEAAVLPAAAPLPPLRLDGTPAGMHQALAAHGWDVRARGLPNNQEEQAYTLLTFGYVPLRALRTLGIPATPAQERAVLHTWNVMGHLVGIRRELMVETMDDAQALFERLQQRGRAEALGPDPRGPLAAALFATLAREIPLPLLRPLPVLLARHLLGPRSSADLQLDGHVGWPARALFALLAGVTGLIDRVGRWFVPGFSLARLATRALGVRLVTGLLMDQTRPLKLPEHLRVRAGEMLQRWGAGGQR